MPYGKYGTVAEAADHFGLSRQRIHELRQKGALGECVCMDIPGGKIWMIPYPFGREDLPVGRPKKEGKQCESKN